ncbi:MAG: NAD+ synthase [Microbacteriaceae bacterium]
MSTLRLALGQINPRLGDFVHNSKLICQMASSAQAEGSDLLAVGELALTGYPLEDLALNPSFLKAAQLALEELAMQLVHDGSGELAVIVGHPSGPVAPEKDSVKDPWTPEDPIAFNSASLLFQGKVTPLHQKHHLPNYAVFDEQRTFLSGSKTRYLNVHGFLIAVIICEDLWRFEGPVAQAKEAGVDLILTINASPYTLDKDELRSSLLLQRAEETAADIAYVNIFGGQDELVFDGQSMVVSASGTLLAQASQFQEELLLTDLSLQAKQHRKVIENTLNLNGNSSDRSVLPAHTVQDLHGELAQIWEALSLGLKDYVQKNGFSSVILGLSGGIDSAVCAALAVDALGADHVYGVSMPSIYSSDHSKDDAHDLAERTGLHYRVEPIAELVAPIEQQLKLEGIAAENAQARIRAMILMGISNSEGQLVLTTGNKTEVAVGYSTIYGDSVGAYAPIKDVLKTLVWDLANWRNEEAISLGLVPPIPENSITKPPSAELRPGQTDQQSLPEYPILDKIVAGFIVEQKSIAELVAEGFEAETVQRIYGLIKNSEWKRHQSTLGPKITARSFGKDRRFPITNRYQG